MGHIQLNTAIPGPKSIRLWQERQEAIAQGVSTTLPICIEKASGALVTDVDGNTLIDLAAGIGSLNVGHAPPSVTEAIKEQVDRFIHPIFSVTIYESYIRLAKKLNELVPGSFPKKTVLFNSGAEAVENAVKIARRYTGRPGIISFERGFHGRTLMAMSLTGKVSSFKRGFGPMATDVYRLPYPYYYRNETDEETFAQLERLFRYEVDPGDIAAVIMEPIQGEGGFIVPSAAFVQELQRRCEQHGILLIADEIQTGIARTGKWFAMEHFGAEADLTVMSKSLGAGIPFSAVTGRADVMDGPKSKELGGTLAGSPLGCVAALKVIELIEEQDLLTRSQAIGDQLRAMLDFPSKTIGEIRGVGAMVAVEFAKDKETREPHPEFVKKLVAECHRRGVIAITAGTHGNIIRLLPPLVITDDQLKEAIEVMAGVIIELEA